VDDWDLSRDHRLLAVSLYPTEDLLVVDLHDGANLLRVPGPRYAKSVAFSPNGRLVAIAGAGLLLVDLLNPQRRGLYTHFFNNIVHIGFSPSGDALVASSYAGRVHIFGYDAGLQAMAGNGNGNGNGNRGLRLTLLQTLRHAGQANVYA